MAKTLPPDQGCSLPGNVPPPGKVAVANATIGMAEEDEEKGTTNKFAFIPFTDDVGNDHLGWRPLNELRRFPKDSKLTCKYDDTNNKKVRKSDDKTYHSIDPGYTVCTTYP